MSPHGDARGPTIQRALRDFLADRRERLSPADFRLYRHVIFFLELCINNYGHRNLDDAERARYEALYDRPGDAGPHFFELFGPERLLPELDFFARAYLAEDVHTSDRVEKRAPEVVSALKEWLLETEIVPAWVVEREERLSRERARLGLRLRRLARKMSRRIVSVEPEVLAEDDYVRPDDHVIARIEPGRIWLRVFRSARAELIGPLLVPVSVTRAVREGWSLCCALGRLRGRWQIIELQEIYPRLVDVPPNGRNGSRIARRVE
jgi:hypothetical protein